MGCSIANRGVSLSPSCVSAADINYGTPGYYSCTMQEEVDTVVYVWKKERDNCSTARLYWVLSWRQSSVHHVGPTPLDSLLRFDGDASSNRFMCLIRQERNYRIRLSTSCLVSGVLTQGITLMFCFTSLGCLY
uniref:Uncharacterized protein n=1 Tax=Aegilops tauschii subsp. strangulata TaxID=200361 RepID=A0A453R0V8_AEGTS